MYVASFFLGNKNIWSLFSDPIRKRANCGILSSVVDRERLLSPIQLLWSYDISYSTVVLYSRDHKGVGVAHKIISPENQPQFSQTTEQYWLGKTKPKKAFRSTRNAFNKLLRNFKKNYSTEFSTD